VPSLPCSVIENGSGLLRKTNSLIAADTFVAPFAGENI
jgi:hypothetical protein